MFFVFPSADAIAQHLSQHIIDTIKRKPNAVLGLATGSTMLPVYQRFAEQVQEHALDLSQVTTYNLDEYVGLAPEHPQSYNHYMHEHLFNKIKLDDSQVYLPSGHCADIDLECKEYSAKIQACGGLDFQLLGIGTNGHIGFNEPYTAFDSQTHVVELSENTRIDNGRFFDNWAEVPTHAITMGIQDIMQAKEIILVATGAHKAEVMANLFNSPIDEAMPASILKQHPRIKIFMDLSAASLIPDSALSTLC